MKRAFLLYTAELTRRHKKNTLRASQFAFFTKYCYSNCVKKKRKEKNCRMRFRDENCVKTLNRYKPKKDYLEDLDVDGRKIKWIL